MPATYWLFVVLTLLLAGFVAYATVRSARLLQHWPADVNPLLLPSENLLRLLLIAVCAGLGRLSGLPPSRLGWRFDHALAYTLWGIVAGLILAALYVVLTRRLVAATGARYYRTTMLRLIVPRTRRQLVAVLLVMVSVVLVEEMLFRSLLIGGLAPVAPVPWLVLASGLIFGALHSPQGRWGMLATALAGIGLGWALVETGSLILPLVAHYVTNSAQIVLAYRLGPRVLTTG
jgi:membrane protease YdiL (CAAX protease family)